MDTDYRIVQVQTKDQWSNEYGTFQTYAVKFDGVQDWVKLNQKVDTPAPSIGDVLHGLIETKTNANGTAFKQFKKVQAQGGGFGGGKSKGYTPEKEQEIRMLALLKVSAQVFSGTGTDVDTVLTFAKELDQKLDGGKVEDTVAEVNDNEEISLDDIPF